MSLARSRIWIVSLVAAWSMAQAVPAHAGESAGARAVRRARLALARYDLTGHHTTDVIADLGRAATELKGPKALEARYLRAMATADLVLIARTKDDQALANRAARAFGVRPKALEGRLISELHRLSIGPYASAASDMIDAFDTVQALDAGTPIDWKKLDGPRTDALFVAHVRKALEHSSDPVQALSAMAADPCAKKGQPCLEPLPRFDAQGRAAAQALLDARADLDRLARADKAGDPFPRALRPELAADAEAIANGSLAAAPMVPTDLHVTVAPGTAQEARARVLLDVQDGEVRYGWVPRVALGDEGELRLVAGDGEPVLPDTKAVPIPQSYRPAVQPIRRLTDVLRGLSGHGSPTTVAVVASDDVSADVVSRVLDSATAAGLAPTMVAGRGPDGGLRGVDVRLCNAFKGPIGQPAVEVRVRLGGYTVKTAHGSADVPRVRDSQGLHFDLDGLAHAIGEPHVPSAAIDYMSVVAMGPVLQAAFRLAPSGKTPLQLLVP